MDDATFRQNVEWNIELTAVQVGHAEKVKGRARSGYYKTAIILAASVVEALAFKVLEDSKLQMPLMDWQCKKSSLLGQSYRGNGNRLSICERVQPVFKLGKNTDFKKVNEVCLNLKIFSKKFFGSVSYLLISDC